jgi:hypothetical protein
LRLQEGILQQLSGYGVATALFQFRDDPVLLSNMLQARCDKLFGLLELPLNHQVIFSDTHQQQLA